MPLFPPTRSLSDKFGGKILKPGWTVSAPNPDSSVGLTGKGYLNITASPKNGGSDLASWTNYNAPNILQPVPATQNWTVTTQVNFDPTGDFQAAGILLATQAGPFNGASQFYRSIEYDFDPGNTLVVRS